MGRKVVKTKLGALNTGREVSTPNRMTNYPLVPGKPRHLVTLASRETLKGAARGRRKPGQRGRDG